MDVTTEFSVNETVFDALNKRSDRSFSAEPPKVPLRGYGRVCSNVTLQERLDRIGAVRLWVNPRHVPPHDDGARTSAYYSFPCLKRTCDANRSGKGLRHAINASLMDVGRQEADRHNGHGSSGRLDQSYF
ncbi:hypothetical protein V7x_55190 [Crateriforma conspicua]|uniref:Uncharacterized protein n=1 Tax=Crateriforma conspicua TaxID=2527996 RepID=A0A5C6FHG0_9PLAN|nr:hypothetical protein V7x_55190 [Crateriforma conspicua]